MPAAVEVTRERITPAIAQEYLGKNFHANRNVRQGHVEALARDITEGNWTENGSTIVFNGDGTLLDGQHRLHAIVVAGKPITTLVVRGVRSEAFKDIDTGARRGFVDWVRGNGYKNVAALSGGTRRTMDWWNGLMFDRPVSTLTELVSFLEENKAELVRAATITQSSRLTWSPFLIPPSVLVAVVATALKGGVPTEHALEFCTNVRTGENYNSPERVLRDRLVSLSRNQVASGHRAINLKHAILVKAWNLSVLGESVQQLSWRPTGGEPFPTMLDHNGDPISVTVQESS